MSQRLISIHLLDRRIQMFAYAWVHLITRFWINFLMFSLSAANYLRHTTRIWTERLIYSTVNSTHFRVCVFVCGFGLLYPYSRVLCMCVIVIYNKMLILIYSSVVGNSNEHLVITIRYQQPITRSLKIKCGRFSLSHK